MRLSEITAPKKPYNYKDNFEPFLLQRGFVEQSEPVGEMGSDRGSPQYYMVHTYNAVMMGDQADKIMKALKGLVKRNHLEKLLNAKQKYAKNGVEIIVTVKYPVETPAPTDRPLIKIPFMKDEVFSVGDEIQVGNSSSNHLGIIGIDGPSIGTIKKDNGDGTYEVELRGDRQPKTISSNDMILIDNRGNGLSSKDKYKADGTNYRNIKVYKEFALHPERGGTVSLTGINKKTGKRERLYDGYIDQVHRLFMQKGSNYQYSGKGIVPDKEWWDSLDSSEKARYAIK